MSLRGKEMIANRVIGLAWFFILSSCINGNELNLNELNFGCDVYTDNCPHLYDGVCDSNLGDLPQTGCLNSDCYDCQAVGCGQYDYDCEGCLNAPGCFWCAEDGTTKFNHICLFFS